MNDQIIKVKILKVHEAWNMVFHNEFAVGDILEYNRTQKTVKSKFNRTFNVKDLAGCYGCTIDEIFEKV